jgi:hypothetical protein
MEQRNAPLVQRKDQPIWRDAINIRPEGFMLGLIELETGILFDVGTESIEGEKAQPDQSA